MIEIVDSYGAHPSPLDAPTCCTKAMSPTSLMRGSLTNGEILPVFFCRSCGKVYEPPRTSIEGQMTIRLLTPDGEEVDRRIKNNVFTDVGRNAIAALLSYTTFTTAPGSNEPATSKRRYDGIRYVGVGNGTQAKTNAVTQLQSPLPFNAGGDYLAQVTAPSTIGGSGISVIVERIFGLDEISMPAATSISEAGLYLGGTASSPTLPSVAGQPLIAYNTFEPVSKTSSLLLALRWEIKL